MHIFNYTLTTYTDYLQQLAAFYGTTVTNNKLVIPPAHGYGLCQTLQLYDGLEILTYDFNFKETLVLKRQPNGTEHYTLVFDASEKTNGFRVTIDTDAPSEAMERTSVFYLTSFLYDVETVMYKDVPVKGIRFLLTTTWMQHYLQLAKREEVLEKYIALKTAGIWYKPVTEELTGLLHELLNGHELPLLFFQNKILRIVELFFEWLYDETKLASGQTGISRNDIELAQKIEARLTKDVTVLPPTIKELARDAAMSESKLKKIFKTVYGLPPYEYFQKQRMQKARLMLLSGNYSVKDIGYTLGYANLSNFTLAFKKVFGKLPSQLLHK